MREARHNGYSVRSNRFTRNSVYVGALYCQGVGLVLSCFPYHAVCTVCNHVRDCVVHIAHACNRLIHPQANQQQTLRLTLTYPVTPNPQGKETTMNKSIAIELVINNERTINYAATLAIIASMGKKPNPELAKLAFSFIKNSLYHNVDLLTQYGASKASGKDAAKLYPEFDALYSLKPSDLDTIASELETRFLAWIDDQEIDRAAKVQGVDRSNDGKRGESKDAKVISVDYGSALSKAENALALRKRTASYGDTFESMDDSMLVALSSKYESLTADGKSAYMGTLKARGFTRGEALTQYLDWQESAEMKVRSPRPASAKPLAKPSAESTASAVRPASVRPASKAYGKPATLPAAKPMLSTEQITAIAVQAALAAVQAALA